MERQGPTDFESLVWLARQAAQSPSATRKQQIDAAWSAADADPNRRHLTVHEVYPPSRDGWR